MAGVSNPSLRREYALWLAAKRAGNPGKWTTKKAWAEAHHTDRGTLYDWEKAPEHKQFMDDAVNGLVNDDDFTTIILIQKRKALEGNTAAANFVAKFKGYLEAPKEKSVSADDFAGMSLAELMALRATME